MGRPRSRKAAACHGDADLLRCLRDLRTTADTGTPRPDAGSGPGLHRPLAPAPRRPGDSSRRPARPRPAELDELVPTAVVGPPGDPAAAAAPPLRSVPPARRSAGT